MSASNQTAAEQRLQEYLSRLAAVLGHADRRERIFGYCTGLLVSVRPGTPCAGGVTWEDRRSA